MLLMRPSRREGRSNAHIKGDYQRIGDVLLKNLQGLRVRQRHVKPARNDYRAHM